MCIHILYCYTTLHHLHTHFAHQSGEKKKMENDDDDTNNSNKEPPTIAQQTPRQMKSASKIDAHTHGSVKKKENGKYKK